MSDLLPCPFCGGEADVYKHNRPAFGASYHVECQEEACLCGTCHHESRDEAIAAWNTRAIDLPGQREGARKVFDWLIAKAQEPVEIFTGSYAKPLHADERTAWLEKMRGEYGV